MAAKLQSTVRADQSLRAADRRHRRQGAGVFRWQNVEGEFLNKKNYPREVRLDSSQLFLASAELDAALVAIDDSYRTVLGKVKPVLLDSREPRNGDPVCFIGHPAGSLEQQRSMGTCA